MKYFMTLFRTSLSEELPRCFSLLPPKMNNSTTPIRTPVSSGGKQIPHKSIVRNSSTSSFPSKLNKKKIVWAP